MTKKIMVTLNDAQYKELRKKDVLGETDSERLRNAFVVFLSTEKLTRILERRG